MRRLHGLRRPVAAGVLLASALLGTGDLDAQSWRTVTVSRQLGAEEHLEARVTYGSGRFRVAPAEPGVLYRIGLRYDEDVSAPVTEYENGRLRVGTRQVGGARDLLRNRSSGELDIRLARGVPTDLRLELGAVRAEVELGGLSLTGLRLSTGASQSRLRVSEPNPVVLSRARLEVGAAEFTASELGNLNVERLELDAGVGDVTLDLAGEWRRDAEVRVEMGLGALELRVPRELGVRLENTSFLTSLRTGDLVERNSAHYSPAWEEAERRVTIHVNAALGSVRVVHPR